MPSLSNLPLCQTPGCRSVNNWSNLSPSHPVFSALLDARLMLSLIAYCYFALFVVVRRCTFCSRWRIREMRSRFRMIYESFGRCSSASERRARTPSGRHTTSPRSSTPPSLAAATRWISSLQSMHCRYRFFSQPYNKH